MNILVFQPSTANNLGTLNNIVTVKKSDFEVFEALALDSVNTACKSKPSKYGDSDFAHSLLHVVM